MGRAVDVTARGGTGGNGDGGWGRDKWLVKRAVTTRRGDNDVSRAPSPWIGGELVHMSTATTHKATPATTPTNRGIVWVTG